MDTQIGGGVRSGESIAGFVSYLLGMVGSALCDAHGVHSQVCLVDAPAAAWKTIMAATEATVEV